MTKVAHASGHWLRLGLVTALLTCVLDQASKIWLLAYYELGTRGTVPLGPFLSLSLTWNYGISYGWLPLPGAAGQWALVILTAAVVVALSIWLSGAETALSAIALGLIIGGAVGNAIDRIAYGAVADFVLFHIETAHWRFQWYVFNLADAAIVAGVIGLLYELVGAKRAVKAP